MYIYLIDAVLAFLSDDITFSKIGSILASIEGGKETMDEMNKMRTGRLDDPMTVDSINESSKEMRIDSEKEFTIREQSSHVKSDSTQESVSLEVRDEIPLKEKEKRPLIEVLGQPERETKDCGVKEHMKIVERDEQEDDVSFSESFSGVCCPPLIHHTATDEKAPIESSNGHPLSTEENQGQATSVTESSGGKGGQSQQKRGTAKRTDYAIGMLEKLLDSVSGTSPPSFLTDGWSDDECFFGRTHAKASKVEHKKALDENDESIDAIIAYKEALERGEGIHASLARTVDLCLAHTRIPTKRPSSSSHPRTLARLS